MKERPMTIRKDDMKCEVALDILGLARDELTVTLKYLSMAFRRLTLTCRPQTNGMATDCDTLYFDPVRIIRCYRKDAGSLQRAYLHTVLHCLLGHPFRAFGKEESLWNFCADLEVEGILRELLFPADTGPEAGRRASMLSGLAQEMPALTAEFLYARYRDAGIAASELAGPAAWFFRDDHGLWQGIDEEDRNDLESEGKGSRQAELRKEWSRILRMEIEKTRGSLETLPVALIQQMPECNQHQKNRYDAFLKRFAVTDEELREDPDAYDFGLYTYGMSLYGNMPLVEPLEYRENEKIREFVIALDTSGSCKGEPIRAFLTRTYDIIKNARSITQKTRLYLIQADDRIRSCRLITGDRDMEDYLANEKLTGFGDTDFRPVFQWVEDQIHLGVLRNLRGLIYFTDGFGTYPDWAPPCEAVFAFVKGNNNASEAPAWATKVEFD